MNEHERILTIFHRQKPDRVPWAPRLDLWYNARLVTDTMPERFKGKALYDIHRELGLGIRGLADVVKLATDGFETRLSQQGEMTTTEYITPVGNLIIRDTLNEEMRVSGVTHPYRVECPLKKAEDYDVLEYVLTHTKPSACYEVYERAVQRVGGDGLVFGGKIKVPYQHWLLDYVGIEAAFYHLSDMGARVERFLNFLADWTREVCKIMVDSPAPVILSSDNFSGVVTSPKLFRQYCSPFLNEFSAALHARGKYLASHFDGEPKPLLTAFPESGVDLAECFTPEPMTQVPLTQAQQLWGNRTIIWGGIPSILLCGVTSEQEFIQAMDTLFAQAVPVGNLILGIGDNLVADGIIERVEYITQLVHARGAIPQKVF